MYLKTIELCGFKSFADKTKIEFDRQLTAVVGPNGCGKSNVVDAIRWCLGEQSAYSLRSPQMLGVIFGGSQSRAPLGLSEVSLTFDNSKKILPLDFTEITITRKIFRSGETEYFINKAQCRLKDIRDMFLDTGVGRSGYSIFEQGKVEFITMAKPEERRALFEEAAGVAKYKVRREETLRKLEKVKEDMNRVNDIMSVIKEQTSTLESAVRKARLFQKYQEELKTLQVADFVKKIDRLSNDLQPLSVSLEELNKEIITRTTQSDTLEASLSEHRFELTRLEKEKADTLIQLSAVDREIAQSEERINSHAKMAEDYTQRNGTLRNNIAEFERTSAVMQKQAEKIKSEIENFSPTVNAMREKYSMQAAEYEKLRSEISRLQNEISRLNTAIIDMMNKKSSVSNDISRIESEIANAAGAENRYNGEVKKVSSEKERITAEINSITGEIENLRNSLGTGNSEIQSLTAEIAEIKSALRQSGEKYQTLRDKGFTLETRAETLRELQKKDPKSRGVYAVMSRGFSGIHGTVSSLLNISGVQENTVANFLGEKLNYVVCSTAKDANDAIEYLRSNSLGFATFIVEELLPESRMLKELFSFRSEKSLMSLVTCEARWEKLAKFLLDDSYASSSGIRSGSIIFGGDTSGTAVPEVEIKVLETESASAKELSAALDLEIKSYEQKLSAITESIMSRNPLIEEMRISLASKENALKDRNRDAELADSEIAVIEKDINRLREESAQKNAALGPMRGGLAALENLIASSRGELAKFDSQVLEMRISETAANTGLTALAKELSAFEAGMQSYEREQKTLFTNLKISAEQRDRSSAEIETLALKIEEMKKFSESEKLRLEELHKNKTGIITVLREIQASYSEIFDKQKKIEEQTTALRNELKEFEEKRHERQMIIRSKEIEKNSLEKQLSEMGIEFNDAKESHVNIEVEEGQIDRLKRRIESMGAVNLAAQDEYSNLESRYNFLLSQQQDLLKAEEDLRNAIYKINGSIKETFHVVFEQVRTNFKMLFSQLFEGGEADLVLTDESNLLETGVEIKVQPAGKKIENGIFLSGGEKALTSIALLFAFFMVKPSPVCVLDEVDAPLDDANVTRFLNMLKTFMESSQFLVITHNKRTMEASDVLYGVTMEDPGISKIISLKIHKPGAETEKAASAMADAAADSIPAGAAADDSDTPASGA